MHISHPVFNMQRLLFLVLALVQIWFLGSCETLDKKPDDDVTQVVDFYSYSVINISGNNVSLEKYRGKVSLVVNVASECGYTHSHYHALTLLQEYFGSTEKFNVLAFPCNQFGYQEPGTDEDILNFAKHRMGANFPVFSKIDVKGTDASPAWSYLIKHSGQTPTWNFWKYLVDHNGHVLSAWGPSTNPDKLYPDIKEAISNIEKDHSHEHRKEGLKEEF